MKFIYKPLIKVKTLAFNLLSDGLSTKKLALGIVLGLAIGTFPVLGVHTIILIGLCVLFRLNQPVVHAVNYASYPLFLLLYIPFLKLGSLFAGNGHIALNLTQIKAAFEVSWSNALAELWHFHVWGVVAWSLTIIPICIALYFILIHSFAKVQFAKEPQVQPETVLNKNISTVVPPELMPVSSPEQLYSQRDEYEETCQPVER
ncbi:MAG: DUF2062 domain-containing protein [Bacteroidales bacterium]|nr:DUF2062 domain-containing protein [Bacteroidales bacterium]